MSKPPKINCYECQKLMVLTIDHDEYIEMECPDKCEGQPTMRVKPFGPFWKPISEQEALGN